MEEELQETVRGILSQVTVYIDDISIHLTSHAPDTLVHLRMVLAQRGLDLVDELPDLHVSMLKDPILHKKYANLRTRFQELSFRVKERA